MKVNVSELSGIALDWAVAKCEGKEVSKLPDMRDDKDRLIFGTGCGYPCRYSSDWSQGGPIIDRELIAIQPMAFDWWAISPDNDHDQFGQTPLIAAMRCLIASKLGEEVEVLDDLLK